MKRFLLIPFVTLLAAWLFGQQTVFYTWNLQVSPADTAVPITTTLDGAVAMANYLFQNTFLNTTLNGNCAAAATSCVLTSVTGIVPGNGLCFSGPPCTITASAPGGVFTLSAGEVALITAVNAGTNTVTLKRNSIGTATAQTSGQVATIIKAGSYTQQTANLLVPSLNAIIQSCQFGAPTTATVCATIASDQSSLGSIH